MLTKIWFYIRTGRLAIRKGFTIRNDSLQTNLSLFASFDCIFFDCIEILSVVRYVVQFFFQNFRRSFRNWVQKNSREILFCLCPKDNLGHLHLLHVNNPNGVSARCQFYFVSERVPCPLLLLSNGDCGWQGMGFGREEVQTTPAAVDVKDYVQTKKRHLFPFDVDPQIPHSDWGCWTSCASPAESRLIG